MHVFALRDPHATGRAPWQSMHAYGSLLELLHPTGSPGVCVMRAAVDVEAMSEKAGADIIVLAPRHPGETTDADLRTMVAQAAAVSEGGGLVLVAARRTVRRRIDRMLTSAGMRGLGPSLLLMRRGTIVSAERRALRHAIRSTPSPWRVLAGAAATAWPQAFELVSLASARPYGAPGTRLAGWLRSNEVPADGGLIVASSWRGDGGSVVVTRIGRHGSLVAKVGRRDGSRDVGALEAHALQLLGAEARAAGVDVPQVVQVVDLAGRSAVLLTALAGRPAALSPSSARETAEAVAGWLARWSSATRSEHSAAPLLDAGVLNALELLASDLPSAYVERVRRMAADVRDMDAPVAAAHGDLTLWNILLGSSGFGVVDWEAATDRSLPLVDLPYLLVDAVMCRQRTADRAAAYEACFGSLGSESAWARDVVSDTARRVGVGEPWLELGMHTCWLEHAADERRRGAHVTPFLDVLRRHAAGIE